MSKRKRVPRDQFYDYGEQANALDAYEQIKTMAHLLPCYLAVLRIGFRFLSREQSGTLGELMAHMRCDLEAFAEDNKPSRF